MADYATIDKAVFKSGYMFSQQGVSNGTNSSNYQTFNPTNLSIFNPNFYIDFLTGKVKCSNIEVTGGTFSIGDNFRCRLFWKFRWRKMQHYLEI